MLQRQMEDNQHPQQEPVNFLVDFKLLVDFNPKRRRLQGDLHRSSRTDRGILEPASRETVQVRIHAFESFSCSLSNLYLEINDTAESSLYTSALQQQLGSNKSPRLDHHQKATQTEGKEYLQYPGSK